MLDFREKKLSKTLVFFFKKKSLLDIDGPGPRSSRLGWRRWVAWPSTGKMGPLKGGSQDIWRVLWWNTSFTLPKTNSSHVKIDLWKRRFLLEITIFQGATLVSGRVIVLYDHSQTHRIHRTTVYSTTLSCLIFMGISCRESHIITSWCVFHQPIWNICASQIGIISPK